MKINDVTCFILAAGDSVRWGPGSLSKTIKLVQGEPLIGRTIRMSKELGVTPIVVTDKPEVIEVAKHYDIPYFEPLHREFLASTALSTRELWGPKNIILLGDVYYGPCFESLFNINKPWQYFGTLIEGFCMSFTDVDAMEKALEVASNRDKYGSFGYLRDALHYLENIPIEWGIQLRVPAPDSFVMIADGTDDIDTPEQYDELLKRIELQSESQTELYPEKNSEIICHKVGRNLHPSKRIARLSI